MPIIIRLCDKKQIYDYVDERKIHNGNISRLGGLGIFIGFFSAYLFLLIIDFKVQFNVIYFTIAMFIAFLTGFIDDLKHINAYIKLLLQFSAGFFVYLSGLSIDKLTFIPSVIIKFGFLTPILTILWVTAFMNAVNLLDGMDGLASGVIIISSIFIFINSLITKNIFVLYLSSILIFSLLGFYIFNFPPAKIFMGDGGAYFIGFVYSILPLIGIKKTTTLTVLIVPIILLMVPILDMINVTRKRYFNGLHVFSADKNHIHHRLMNIGFSNKGIIFIIYAYTAVLGFFSIIMNFVTPIIAIIIMGLLFILTILSFITITQAEKKIEKLENVSNNGKK